MDLHEERGKRLKMIAHAMKITPEARNAHPWIAPLWDEVQYLQNKLDNTPKQDEELAKTARQILDERKAEAAKPKKKTTRKAKTDEEGQG